MAPSEPDEVPDLLAEIERQAATRRWFLANLPWLFTGALFLLVVVKLLLIARNNPTTAYAIVTQSGPLDAAGGVILQSLPFLTVGLTFVVLTAAQTEAFANQFGPERRRIWWLYGILLFVLSFIASWVSIVLLLWYPLALFVLWPRFRRWRQRQKGRDDDLAHVGSGAQPAESEEPPDAILRALYREVIEVDREIQAAGAAPVDLDNLGRLRVRREQLVLSFDERRAAIVSKARRPLEALLLVLAVLIVGQTAFTTLNGTPWLPAERIRVSQQRAFTGFVLSVDDQWTSVLVNSDRSVRRIKSSAVSSREVCSASETKGSRSTIWDLFGSKPGPSYRAC
jgi:hypothetical protein